jgi:uncharacterized protein DUF5916/cellulose/xylan binding protein with CBM9 domain
MKKTLVVCLVAAAATFASAETPPAPPIQIHRAEGAIRIDGDLADPGWNHAASISAFVEGQPGDNTPAKVKTVAYLTYDDRYFYIGVRCEDPNPQKIRAPYVERDNVLGTDDNVAIFLDTRNDHRTSMELRVNPRGIQADGIYNDTGSIEDFSPDYFYDTAGRIDSGGWSAEYAIPFSSLRYPDRPDQTWNILIWRNYPREFRYAFYNTPVPRNSNCLVCHSTPIAGLTGLPHSGHLVAAPYVTGQHTENPTGAAGSPLERAPFHKDAGLDVKWTPTANNAVDMTVNPDFSQVESDVAQITANQRFAVFFPEKRPFFLEGFDLFDTPLQVAYTRTITSPRWGARSTGRLLGSAYTLLVTGDRGGGSTIIPGPVGSHFAPQDFKSLDTIARIRRDIGRSFIGAVFTDREIRGGGYNRVTGPDVQWWPTPTDALNAELLLSSTQNPDRPVLSSAWNGAHSTSYAFHTSWDRKRERYVAGAFAEDIGKTFRADLGFLPQSGYRNTGGYFGLRFYPDNQLFRSIRPSVLVDRQTDTNGNEIYRGTSSSVFLQGAKNLAIGFTWHASEHFRVKDRLLSENYADWSIEIDPSRRVPHVALTGFNGQRIDFANGRVGTGGTLGLTATVRPLDILTFDANVNREWLDVSGGNLYSASVDRLKATYSFSAKSLVRIIAQYLSTDRNPSLYTFATSARDAGFQGSILYSYKINWQTVLYLGYGDERVLTLDNDLSNLHRSLFFKVSYAIQR